MNNINANTACTTGKLIIVQYF